MKLIWSLTILCLLGFISPASAGFLFSGCTADVPQLRDAEKLVCECSLLESNFEQLECFDKAKNVALKEARGRCQSLSLSENSDYWCTQDGEVSRLLFHCMGGDLLQRLNCYQKVGRPTVLIPAFYLRLARELGASRYGREGMIRAIEEHSN